MDSAADIPPATPPTPALPNAENTLNSRRIQWAVWLFVAVGFLFCARQLVNGWDRSVMDQYAFRQVQTAIGVDYLLRDGFTLNYETPVLGKPWSIPFEFPTYQLCVALIAKTGWFTLDQSGRVGSILFWIACLLPLHLLLKPYVADRPTRWAVLLTVWSAPTYLFWSSSFLIESCALFFSLLYLCQFVRMLRFPSTGNILGTVLIGSLAGLTKATTFLIAATPAVLFAAHHLWLQWPDIGKLRKPALAAAIGLLAPLGALLLWTAHADSVKMQNPMAHWLVSHALAKWNYGTLAQKLSWQTWNQILHYHVDIELSNGRRWYLTGALILLTAAILKNRNRLPIIALVAAFLTGPMLFTNLFFIHLYYSYEVAVYLQLAVALAIIGLTATLPPARREGLRLMAWVLIAYWGAHGYTAHDRPWTKTTLTPAQMRQSLAPLAQAGNSNDVLLIYGHTWDPTIPYYSGRKAIMVYEQTDEQVNQSLAKLDANEKIAALIVYGPLTNDTAMQKTNVDRFHLNPTPLETDYGRVFLKQ